jgi:PD-(D/E)XK nuclease superfamily
MNEAHRVISNSEALTWLKCPRKYYYTYDLALEPINPPVYFFRGNVVHSAHERYYKAIMAGASHDDAVEAGKQVFIQVMQKEANADNMQEIATLRTMMLRYWDEIARFDDWEILAVEQNYNLPLTDEMSFGFTPDLIARIDGLITVVDHKNVYDFWKRRELDLDPQSRKYMAALIGMGKQVDRVMHNQTRYRLTVKRIQTKDELFRRDFATPNADERRGMIAEQIKVMLRIKKHRELSMEERERDALRVLDKITCEKCPFAELCYGELRGGKMQTLIETEFQENSYAKKYQKEIVA